tara:strand:+ start:368 stop:553 length:186 start_codon:yes stop_codon:yes gene_type:complete
MDNLLRGMANESIVREDSGLIYCTAFKFLKTLILDKFLRELLKVAEKSVMLNLKLYTSKNG